MVSLNQYLEWDCASQFIVPVKIPVKKTTVNSWLPTWLWPTHPHIGFPTPCPCLHGLPQSHLVEEKNGKWSLTHLLDMSRDASDLSICCCCFPDPNFWWAKILSPPTNQPQNLYWLTVCQGSPAWANPLTLSSVSGITRGSFKQLKEVVTMVSIPTIPDD